MKPIIKSYNLNNIKEIFDNCIKYPNYTLTIVLSNQIKRQKCFDDVIKLATTYRDKIMPAGDHLVTIRLNNKSKIRIMIAENFGCGFRTNALLIDDSISKEIAESIYYPMLIPYQPKGDD